jgi:hypothetical protein
MRIEGYMQYRWARAILSDHEDILSDPSGSVQEPRCHASSSSRPAAPRAQSLETPHCLISTADTTMPAPTADGWPAPAETKKPATCYSPTDEHRSTIAAEALHFRVRDGNGCFRLAMVTGKKASPPQVVTPHRSGNATCTVQPM